MKQKKYIISILLLILLIILVVVGMIQYQKIKDKKTPVSSKVANKVKNKESFIVFITDNEATCRLCKETRLFVDLVNERYKLNILYYDTSKHSKEDYAKLRKDAEIPEDYITAPAVVIINDGHMSSIANNLMSERFLKDYLEKNNFITREQAEKEEQLSNKEQFNKALDTKEAKLVLRQTYTEECYKYRNHLYKLSKKYKFNYYTVFTGIGDTGDIDLKYYNDLKNIDIKTPSLAIIKNKKIVDYSDSEDDKEILHFLKKHGIVN